MSKITAIVNAHAEGVILGMTLRSMAEAVRHATAVGHEVESLIVVDRPDPVTRAVAEAFCEVPARVLLCDHGELSASRNQAVEEASGDFIGFLDGDDLWGFNWLTEAVRLCEKDARKIAHPEINAMFGDRGDGSRNYYWEHIDSADPSFDASFLMLANCWSALSFARRSVYITHPYEPNRHKAGYGFEDWHWNSVTLSEGYAHSPVPGTVHFIRRRVGSLSRQSVSHGVVVRPTPMQRFSTRAESVQAAS